MNSATADDLHCIQQIHIDAARNSTDDFNPFHEPRKCRAIRGNPYPGAIVLGFQLECLIEYQVNLHRDRQGENDAIARRGLHFSNYQLTFANALLPGEAFRVEIKPTIYKDEPPSLSNRVLIRSKNGMVMIGYKRETRVPLFLADCDLGALPDLRQAQDREFLPGSGYFLKRKFLNTGNAKNFIAGSLCDQGYYFDELEDRVNFPDMFPAALTSCALLEKAMKEKHDFMANPMVYMAHNISVDRRLARGLRSNDALHLLVRGPEAIEEKKGLRNSQLNPLLYRCLGLVHGRQMLFRAEVYLAPLEAIAAAQ